MADVAASQKLQAAETSKRFHHVQDGDFGGGWTTVRAKQYLKNLRETLRQELQETGRTQTEELEKRIQQNSLLCADADQKMYAELSHHIKYVGTERFPSTTPKSSHKCTLSGRPHTASPARTSSAYQKYSSAKTQLCERFVLSKMTQLSKEEEAEAECQKKFCALPVPSHVTQPIYQEMMELKEKERKQSHEQRKQFLLSIQEPFSFHEREKEKRGKLMAVLNQISDKQKKDRAPARKPLHKDIKESSSSEMKAQEEVETKVHTKESPGIGTPKLRAAEWTRKEKLGFLDEKPSFKPKIIHQVPDFRKLHKALETETLKKIQVKDVTKCQPFFLRTSARPTRQSKMSPENSQEPKINILSRSKSLGALTLISADTLPTYITDAVRKRSMAVRKSMELRDSKNQDSLDWLRSYEMRSQAMKKAVTLHAKLLDPHSSLKEVYNEKLQHHREADQQRIREYMRELREMKARVSERPYLFEQVKQRSAKTRAEQIYRSKLKKAGLQEQFVEENGESVKSEDEPDMDELRPDSNFYSREANVADGEKIEDVEEKSVKTKGEEMP
ncbi:protein FAM161B [Pholidichthys leucotaenia]